MTTDDLELKIVHLESRIKSLADSVDSVIQVLTILTALNERQQQKISYLYSVLGKINPNEKAKSHP